MDKDMKALADNLDNFAGDVDHSEPLMRKAASIIRAIFDPENQPSQFGTELFAERIGPTVQKSGDLRMLGACDGFAHAIVRLRQEIGATRYHVINPLHVRRIAAREAKLKPLREIEAWLVKQHAATQTAYRATLSR